MMKRITLLIAVFIILLTGSISPVQSLSGDDSFSSLIGTVNISTTIPDSPSDAIAYQTVSDPNDLAYYSVTDLEKVRLNVTSATGAPQVATNILNNYGGLPQDAVLVTAETEYLIEMNGTTQEEVSRYPVCTNVQYGRKINDVPVVGDGAYINMELGDNGELLYLNKVWRSVSPAGNQSIIPVSTAIEKLRHGVVLNPKSAPFNVNITKIRLGYYEKGRNQSQEYLEPAWLFRGTTDTGESIKYYVYARHFANFTASSTNISTFQTVEFTDTSETVPTKWYWEFGDGTNSTEQNPPSHMYRTAGNFTVNLTAWNDMGSDTETKTGYIRVNFNKPLNADFNATPRVASTEDTIQFYDASDSSPVNWFWEFGDGTNTTGQNPTHVYTTGGNYTINLTAGNSYGSDTRSVENYIRIYPYPKPVANFTTNYTHENVIVPLAVAFNDTSCGNITGWFWDFGDGMNSTGQNPDHLFNVPSGELFGYYIVNLTVTDDVGRTSTFRYNIDVKKALSPDFRGEPVSGPVPLNVTFTDLTPDSGLASKNEWNFGDGTYSESSVQPFPATISHEYNISGRYNVTLTYYTPILLSHTAVSSMGGMHPNAVSQYDQYSMTKEFYINVSSPELPIADFSANVTSGKKPLAVGFTDSSIGFPTRWNWTFGDGTGSVDPNPVHTYITAGTFTVSLNASNTNGGNSSTKIDYITVFPSHPPAADFTANITIGRSPLIVAFADNSTNSPVNWSWDFGDDTNSTGQNPVHAFDAPGKYTVSLRVMNDDGSDTLTRTDYITVLMELPTMTIVPPPPVLPVSNFTATPLSGKEPLTVIFNDSSTGIPVGWSWSFGDGEASSEKDPIHSYTSAGNYTVSLTTVNPYGTNTTTRVDYITVFLRYPPVAGFVGTPRSGTVPLTVAFNDTSAGSPISWNWTFGDGTNVTDQNPVHTNLSEGNFTVSLMAANLDGSNTTTKIDYITVSAVSSPAANFTSFNVPGTRPVTIQFTDTSTGMPTLWNWSFGDQSFSTQKNPVHEYSLSGVYTVQLTVTNTTTGTNTTIKSNYINVTIPLVPPVADFTGTPLTGTAPLTVTFTDLSTGNPTIWNWSFGDSNTTNATMQNPVHRYTTSGVYTVPVLH